MMWVSGKEITFGWRIPTKASLVVGRDVPRMGGIPPRRRALGAYMSVPEPQNPTSADWHTEVFRILKSFDVKHVVYVPDAAHATTIRLAEDDNEITAVVLTTEEE